MIQKKTVKKSGLLALAMIMALSIWSTAVFADETDVGSVSLNITAGEHGTVIGKSGSFTETVAAGSDLTLRCEGDEGYVIGAVTVNDAELAYADLEGIIGEKAADLTVEEVTVDLSLTVTFAEAGTDASDSTETGMSGDETAAGTENENEGNMTTGEGSDSASGETSDGDLIFTGSGDEDAALQTEGTIDEPGSLSTGEDNAEETLLDDSGKAGGEEDGDEQEQGGSAGDAETDDRTQAEMNDDETSDDADQSTDEKKQAEETGKAGSDEQRGKTGDESKKASADTAKGSQYSDESPRTGDSFPMTVILLMLVSLCGVAGIALHALLKHRDADA